MYILPLLKYKKKSLLFVYFISLHKYFAVKWADSEFHPLLAVEISDDWIVGNQKIKHISNSQEYGYISLSTKQFRGKIIKMPVGQSWKYRKWHFFSKFNWYKMWENIENLKIFVNIWDIKNIFDFFISDDTVVRNFNRQHGVKFWKRQLHCEIFK